MKMVSFEHHGPVALVKLKHGVSNALGPNIVQELETMLRRIRDDDDVSSLVLASSNEKFFSIGFDIPVLFEMNRDDFQEFYRSFNRFCMALFTLPKPTVAAITGHAIAGGCILALCCDYRFIAKGHKFMGLNEVRLGLPVPYLPDRILHALLGFRNAREMMESGEFYPPEKALEMGIVDKILPAEDVVTAAVEHADTLGALPKAGYGMIKENRVEVIAEAIMARQDQKETAFLGSWYSDEARGRLQEAMKKF